MTTGLGSLPLGERFRFAAQYAIRHLALSLAVALLTAAVVFGLLYPPPYQAMLGVEAIFLLVMVADVVCGPLLTLILASPRKSRRERWLDFGLIGLIQALALAYGLHSVWVARPAVLAFEVDRLVVVTANEVDVADLPNAPPTLRRLPWWGVQQVGTRRAASGAELMDSVQRGLAGWSPAAQPGWWLPWDDARADLKARAKPLPELIARRPPDAQALLRAAAQAAGADPAKLLYLPLTNSSTKDWVALLDADLRLMGHVAVDGF